MENTSFNPAYTDEPYYFKHLCVVVQYEAKLNAEKLMKIAKALQNSRAVKTQVSKKNFHFRLADENTALQLTGTGTTPSLPS
mmetsp:Transcript_34387/g.60265  ORF Transcript_34387/g.60265 Transcript_34387/m.60265 type:complete len:82 (+) Transcript_34387:320-565(+)